MSDLEIITWRMLEWFPCRVRCESKAIIQVSDGTSTHLVADVGAVQCWILVMLLEEILVVVAVEQNKALNGLNAEGHHAGAALIVQYSSNGFGVAWLPHSKQTYYFIQTDISHLSNLCHLQLSLLKHKNHPMSLGLNGLLLRLYSRGLQSTDHKQRRWRLRVAAELVNGLYSNEYPPTAPAWDACAWGKGARGLQSITMNATSEETNGAGVGPAAQQDAIETQIQKDARGKEYNQFLVRHEKIPASSAQPCVFSSLHALQVCGSLFECPSRYLPIKPIGKGAYGVVW